MTVATDRAPQFVTHLINGLLSVKPLADFAKHQARSMMIKRAESIGVYWREEVQALRSRTQAIDFSAEWDTELKQIENPDLAYPDYYLRSFHAYEEGNLGWQPAMEVEVAARAVHARLWDEGANGDARLRQSYHDRLKTQIPEPTDILDLGCSVGMSTFALHDYYPNAQLTGVDLSPYFLAIAQYRSLQRQLPVHWMHAPAEATGLPDASFDLVSAFLLFHELPRMAAVSILHEARRVLRPGGYLAIMEMNPKSEIYAAMPPYILTLLKSTEPYLDDYFTFDIENAIEDAGFTRPTQACNSPRHRTLIAQAR